MKTILFGVLLVAAPLQCLAIERYCWGGEWEGECCTTHIFGIYHPNDFEIECTGITNSDIVRERYNREYDMILERVYPTIRKDISLSIQSDIKNRAPVLSKKFVDESVHPALANLLFALLEKGMPHRTTAIKGGFHKKKYCDKKTHNKHCAGIAVDLVPKDNTEKGYRAFIKAIGEIIPDGVRYIAQILTKKNCPVCTGTHIHFQFQSRWDAEQYFIMKNSTLYNNY